MTPPAPLPDPERGLYRRRRLVDMARLLPMFGVLLVLLPLLWQPAERGETATISLGSFLFTAWLGLIAAAFLLSHALGKSGGDRTGDDAQMSDADVPLSGPREGPP